MDVELQNEVNEALEYLRKVSVEGCNFDEMDPVAKMMFVALLHESHSIKDEIKATPERIAERYCSDFIPHENVCATPAIALLQPRAKKEADITAVDSGAVFTYKKGTDKQSLNYIPLFKTLVIPYSDIFILTHDTLSFGTERRAVNIGAPNQVWMGIATKAEVESLQGLSILIKGTNGITPSHIYVGLDNHDIDFATMNEMEIIETLEPFDAQQASGVFFAMVNQWKEALLNMDDAALVSVTDNVTDRDLFKPRLYPRKFQQWLENETLDCFQANTLWIELDFPKGYVVPDTFEAIINVLPVVNVNVNSLTLSPASPIAKLQKQENAFFLKVLETSNASQKQGFGSSKDDIIIRDFDAECYNNGDLYRDVRNLYNKFIDNYYAFIEYNGIKDGEVLKRLRETINKLGKSVGDKNSKYKFGSGTYVMKNMNQPTQTSSTKVSYVTTQGKAGNAPKTGETMENRKLPAIEQKVSIVVSAMGGTDKATADERYELLRYYSLTNDRLYTKMDIDAFLRKEIMAEFGKEEFKRIFIKISVGGTGAETKLVRGLYIDLEFKDKKNYDNAVAVAFDKLMKQKIENNSCIAMPIMVTLVNLE